MFNSIKSNPITRRVDLELARLRNIVSLARHIIAFFNFIDSIGGDKDSEARLLVEFIRERTVNHRIKASEVKGYIKVRSFILCILHDNVE